MKFFISIPVITVTARFVLLTEKCVLLQAILTEKFVFL